MGFPCGLAGKESACNEGDLGLIPGLGRSPGEGEGYPLQDSALQNSKIHWEGIGYPLQYYWASLVAQLIKNLSAI